MKFILILVLLVSHNLHAGTDACDTVEKFVESIEKSESDIFTCDMGLQYFSMLLRSSVPGSTKHFSEAWLKIKGIDHPVASIKPSHVTKSKDKTFIEFCINQRYIESSVLELHLAEFSHKKEPGSVQQNTTVVFKKCGLAKLVQAHNK